MHLSSEDVCKSYKKALQSLIVKLAKFESLTHLIYRYTWFINYWHYLIDYTHNEDSAYKIQKNKIKNILL